MTDLDDLTRTVRRFAAERDWERFHSQKNLAMAVAGEAGDLVALFQWLSEPESAAYRDPHHPQRRLVEEEIADVLIYLVRLGDVLGIDLAKAAERKIVRNRERFPIPGASS